MSAKAKISKAGNLQLTQEALEQRPLGAGPPEGLLCASAPEALDILFHQKTQTILNYILSYVYIRVFASALYYIIYSYIKGRLTASTSQTTSETPLPGINNRQSVMAQSVGKPNKRVQKPMKCVINQQ